MVGGDASTQGLHVDARHAARFAESLAEKGFSCYTGGRVGSGLQSPVVLRSRVGARANIHQTLVRRVVL
jgi:hypothetical protein